MAGDFVRASKAKLCPVCGADHYCGWSVDLSVINCTHTSRKPRESMLPAPSGYELWKAGTGDNAGVLYRKVGPDGKPVKGAVSEEDLEKRAKAKAEHTAYQIKKADEAMAEIERSPGSGVNHPRVRAYLEARGIPLDRLPGGMVPPAIRYHHRALDVWDKKAKAWVVPPGPAMVVRAMDIEKIGRGMHVTYLDPGGAPRKREQDPQKRMVGPLSGAPLRLGGDHSRGALCVTEGVENGVCVIAATGLLTWVAGSADHMMKIDISPKLVRQGGAIHTIILCGDFNRLGKGQRACAVTRNMLLARWPWLKVYVRVPGIRDVPSMFAGEGQLADGVDGVDWNDAVRETRADGLLGIDVIGETILGGIDLEANRREAAAGVGAVVGVGGALGVDPSTSSLGAPITGGTRAAESFGGGGGFEGGDAVAGDGDEPDWGLPDRDVNTMPVLMGGDLDRARLYLIQRARNKGATRFRLARWAGKWWMYVENRYVEVPDEWLLANVHHWLNGFCVLRELAKRTERKLLNPGKDTAVKVMDSLVGDTFVSGKRMPRFLPSILGEDGKVRWGDTVSSRHLEVPEEDDKAARSIIIFRNGTLDMAKVADREEREPIRLEPHTPNLFSTVALPFDLDIDRLRLLIDGKPEREVIEPLCPNFYKFNEYASGGDRRWIEQKQLMFGDVVSGDRSGQWIFVFVGAPNAGKTTDETALKAVVGVGNYAALSLSSLTGDFGLAPLVGKTTAISGDAQMRKFSDDGAIVETLKTISGNCDVPVRDLYEKSQTIQLACRFCIFCNGMPDLRDDGGALARRLIILPYVKPIVDPDPRAMERVKDEAPGILLWSLMGAIKLARMDDRNIKLCANGDDMKMEYETRGAPIKAFANDCLKADPLASCTPDEIYAAYKRWCVTDQQREPMGHGRFFEAIRMFLGPDYKYSQPRSQGGGRQRVVKGWLLMDGHLADAPSAGTNDPHMWR